MRSDPHKLSSSVTRRVALGALAAGGLGVALWPRTPRRDANIPTGRVVLRYWEKWTGTEGDAVQAVVDRFNETQDRIWVQRTPVSDIAAKTMTAIGGGDPPDLVGLYSYHVALFAETRAAMSIDEFAGVKVTSAGNGGAGVSGGAGGSGAVGGDGGASRSAALDPEMYAPSIRELLSFGGKQWAGVNTCYALALYYNKGMLREAGIDPERPPRTTKELDAIAERLVKVGSDGRLERVGFLQNLPTWWPYFWPIMFGGRLFDREANRALIDEPASVAAYSWVQECAARLGAKRSWEFGNQYGRNFHSPDDPFISGKAAMIVQGPWIANFINVHGKKKADGKPELDYAAVPVPVDESVLDPARPLGMLEADVIMIPRGCPHPAEAFEFFCYMQRRDVQERLAVLHCKSSPMRECSPGFMETHPNASLRVHDAVVKSERAIVLPQTRVWQAITDVMGGAFESMWQGKDVKTTLGAVQTRAQGMLDRAGELKKRRG